MRRWLLVIALVVLVGGVAFGILRRPPEWNAATPEALAELQAGLEALEKVYYADARQRLSRALEIDPGCVAAKVFLLDVLDGREDGPARKKILKELDEATLEGLTDREVFLVRYARAEAAGKREESEKTLDAFMARNPREPVALRLRASRAFGRGNYEEAQKEYERLLEVAPNYVVAYNQLGYSAMGQGEFAEAEQMLRKYRFIAPDQANPHDSLGELLLLLGRYQEAEAEFNAALAVKGDFCASYNGLALLGQVSGRLDLADEALRRAESVGKCTAANVAGFRTALERWRAATAADWERVAEIGSQSAVGEVGSCPFVLTHRALLALGETERASALEDQLKKKAGVSEKGAPNKDGGPCLLHLEGVRLLSEGRAAQAVERFVQADERLSFRGSQAGVFKLYNLVNLSAALRVAGNGEEADKVTAHIRSINPDFAVELLRALSLSP